MSQSVDDFNKKRLRSSNITVVVSISLVLFLVGLFGMILINARKYSDFIKEQLVVEVFFLQDNDSKNRSNPLQQQQSIYKEIAAQDFVKKAKYISREEASEIARKELGIETNTLFDEHIFPASVEVTLKPDYIEPSKMEIAMAKLNALPGVSEVKNDTEFSQTIYYSLERILLWILGFTILFLGIAILLINSSIRLKVFSKRFIIKTMQLVGAKRIFILKPFVREAVILGGIGGMIGLTMLFTLWYYFTQEIQAQFAPEPEHILWIALGVFLIGIAITVVSTILATWRFLRTNIDDLYYN